MKRTTVYLPDDLKRRVERTAREQKRSEAEVIRTALDAYTAPLQRRRPTLPLFTRGEVAPITDWDEAMRGFGEG